MTISLTDSTQGALVAIPAPIVSDGDMMLITRIHDGGALLPPVSAGWTLIHQHEHTGATLDFDVWFKEASSESGDYDMGGLSTSSGYLHAYRDSVGGGTWSFPDDAISESNSATVTTTAVTTAAGDMLQCGFGNDSARTVTTAPVPPMTAGEGQSGNSHACFNYFEIPGAGSPTRTLVWNATEQTIESAIVMRYTIAGFDFPFLLPQRIVRHDGRYH